MAKQLLDKSGINEVFEVSVMDDQRRILTKKTIVCYDATKAIRHALTETKSEHPKMGIFISSCVRLCTADVIDLNP